MSNSTGPRGYSTDPVVRAGQLRAEGRFGGPQPGSGRPRIPRPSEKAAEAAQTHWEEIESALLAGIREGSGEARGRSAARWVTLAQREDHHDLRARRDAREEDAFDRMSIDDIIEHGTDVVMKLLRDGSIDLDGLRALAKPEPVQDAVVVDE